MKNQPPYPGPTVTFHDLIRIRAEMREQIEGLIHQHGDMVVGRMYLRHGAKLGHDFRAGWLQGLHDASVHITQTLQRLLDEHG